MLLGKRRNLELGLPTSEKFEIIVCSEDNKMSGKVEYKDCSHAKVRNNGRNYSEAGQSCHLKG